jgi:hypothetical protein
MTPDGSALRGGSRPGITGRGRDALGLLPHDFELKFMSEKIEKVAA